MTDPYLDTANGVLKNKLGITDPAALEAAEAQIVAVRDAEIAANPVPGTYDLKHLRSFHRRLFGDVYTWAGRLRTVDIAKGGTHFCRAEFLESSAADVFRMVEEANFLRESSREEVVKAVAAQLAEINALHPFREGNGRAQRAFFRQMAAEAGWRVDWAAADEDENVAASVTGMIADLGPLEAMLDPLISPTRVG